MFDVGVMIAAGIVGYFLRRWKYPVSPFIIGLVLGPTTENSLRQTLLMFQGDPSLIVDRPLAIAMLALAIAFLVYRHASSVRGKGYALKMEEGKSL
jgi:putative tricarboxylic transport membrane protein